MTQRVRPFAGILPGLIVLPQTISPVAIQHHSLSFITRRPVQERGELSWLRAELSVEGSWQRFTCSPFNMFPLFPQHSLCRQPSICPSSQVPGCCESLSLWVLNIFRYFLFSKPYAPGKLLMILQNPVKALLPTQIFPWLPFLPMPPSIPCTGKLTITKRCDGFSSKV